MTVSVHEFAHCQPHFTIKQGACQSQQSDCRCRPRLPGWSVCAWWVGGWAWLGPAGCTAWRFHICELRGERLSDLL